MKLAALSFAFCVWLTACGGADAPLDDNSFAYDSGTQGSSPTTKQLSASSSGANEATQCPSSTPATGDQCTNAGSMTCDYDNASCECVERTGSDPVWRCRPVVSCPSSEPTSGDACTTQMTCGYGAVTCDCAPDANTAVGNFWQCDDPPAPAPVQSAPAPAQSAPAPAQSAPDMSSFAAAWDVMSASCAGCHTRSFPRITANESNYSSSTKQSIALAVSRNVMPPGGGLSASDKQAIIDWASQ